jgi:hypothetical protein
LDTLLVALQRRLAIVRFLPAGAGALVVAELFYKFHSFTAECLAFLVTWLAFDLVREGFASLVRGPNRDVSGGR